MTITKEVYVDLQEKYGKVMKLVKEIDPEETPYVSKYLAKQELICMKASIEDLLRKHTNEQVKLNGMYSFIVSHYVLKRVFLCSYVRRCLLLFGEHFR